MVIELTAQSIITAGGVVTALGILIGLVVKLVHWVDEQKEQGERIQALEKKHQEDMEAAQKENELIIEGLLGCLKGLQEKGCNGPVTEKADKIERYLNEKAHSK